MTDAAPIRAVDCKITPWEWFAFPGMAVTVELLDWRPQLAAGIKARIDDRAR
jgi:hypothetical protein